MLNPVVLPLPLALAVIAALAAAAYIYRRWLENTPNPGASQPWAKPTVGRHRLTRALAADPHRRDWAALAAERINSSYPVPVIPGPEQAEPERFGILDPQVPLAEVEEYLRVTGCADWRQPLTDFERRDDVIKTAGHDDHPTEIMATLPARIEDTRERAGNAMWSWADGDTHELAATR